MIYQAHNPDDEVPKSLLDSSIFLFVDRFIKYARLNNEELREMVK